MQHKSLHTSEAAPWLAREDQTINWMEKISEKYFPSYNSFNENPHPETYNSVVIRDNKLRAEHLTALLEKKAVAIVISHFSTNEFCEKFTNNVLSSDKIEPYTHELLVDGAVKQEYFGVDRVGVPFNSTYNHDLNSNEKRHYYESINKNLKLLSDLSYPNLPPSEELRNQINTIYSQGTIGAEFEGKPMMAGIVRIVNANNSHLSAEQPHFDALPLAIETMDAQLAANIYMQIPSEGGFLEIWNVPPLKPDYVVPCDWRSKLPTSLKIQPQKGDLVLFNCRMPHAIGAFKGEPRISVQMFIGYKKDKPLFLWN